MNIECDSGRAIERVSENVTLWPKFKLCFINAALVTAVTGLVTPQLMAATPPNEPTSMLEVPEVNSTLSRYFKRLIASVDAQPNLSMARSELRAAYAMRDALGQALYNPELGAEIEKEGSGKNYQVSLSQTIDLNNKRDVQRQQGQFEALTAIENYRWSRQQQMAEALNALVTHSKTSRQFSLLNDQEAQLQQLISVMSERQAAGDIGPADTQLALYSLSQKLLASTQAAREVAASETRLTTLLPNWQTDLGLLPNSIWQLAQQRAVNPNSSANWQTEHPRLKGLAAEVNGLLAVAKLSALQQSADPTIGVAAGKNQNDNLLGISFSMPLMWRNTRKSETLAANNMAAAKQAERAQVHRQQLALKTTADKTLVLLDSKRKLFQRLIHNEVDTSTGFLERQWRAGDLSTTEYLLARQQRTEAQLAEIELQSQYQFAVIDSLFNTGRIDQFLTQFAASSSQTFSKADFSNAFADQIEEILVQAVKKP